MFWHKKGLAFAVEYMAAPFRDEKGGAGAVVTFRDITTRKRTLRRLAVQHAVSSVMAEASTFAEAAPRLLRDIGEALEWQAGAVWAVDRSANVLRCTATWSSSSFPAGAFDAATRSLTIKPGEELVGRVWTSGKPAWSIDILKEAQFPRASLAAEEGLHAAVSFPIRIGREVLGSMEFFSVSLEAPDKDLLQTMATLGYQVGQFIEREWAEESLRRSEELKKTAQAEQFQLAALAAEIGTAVIQTDVLPDMLRRCTEALVRHLDGAFARIWTLNEKDNVLELKARPACTRISMALMAACRWASLKLG